MKQDFKGFADDMLDVAYEAMDIDGADIQEIALKHGLIKEVIANAPCCDNCNCADTGLDFPLLCYRKTYNNDTPFDI